MPVEAERMTAAERNAHERETLSELRTQLERLNASPHEFRKVRDVRLEGDYPDTRLVVTYWDSRHDSTGRSNMTCGAFRGQTTRST
jgi:hypothetical protein